MSDEQENDAAMTEEYEAAITAEHEANMVRGYQEELEARIAELEKQLASALEMVTLLEAGKERPHLADFTQQNTRIAELEAQVERLSGYYKAWCSAEESYERGYEDAKSQLSPHLRASSTCGCGKTTCCRKVLETD